MSSNPSTTRRTEVLILGAGLAGMTTALECADRGHQVLLVSKAEDPFESNSRYAQGGIIRPPFETTQELDRLRDDIQRAGCGIGNVAAIDQLVRLGAEYVDQEFIDRFAVPFDRGQSGDLDTCLEGGHSDPHVIHCGDRTGFEIQKRYSIAVQDHPNISILSGYSAVDILTIQHHCDDPQLLYHMHDECCGAYLLEHASGTVYRVAADYTLLATGGVGDLYVHSTNSTGSIGDGLVMASRAGAALLFPHYIQFHPTAFWGGKRRFLISEAVRGAGAQLLNRQGERFMKRYAPEQLELAPRDQVTRAIVREMFDQQDEYVYLNLQPTALSRDEMEARFPAIFAHCLEHGLDPSREPIPVVPAAHYLCGGIKVDLQGRSTLNRLYAVGEVSCTGVHGANRLASTSLLECLVWGKQAAADMAARLDANERLDPATIDSIKAWHSPPPSAGQVDRQRLAGDWSRIRTVMWNYVGILRSAELLDIAAKDFRLLSENLRKLYFGVPLCSELLALFHGVHACRIIVEAALKDGVSRGCHHRLDQN